MRVLKHFKKAKKGLALAMTAVMLPVFGVIMVFAIDLALAQKAQTRLETAVNHAADAAVLRLPDDQGATAMATSMVNLSLVDHVRFGKNLTVGVSVDLLSNSITVQAQMDANSYFGALANKTVFPVAAEASRSLLP